VSLLIQLHFLHSPRLASQPFFQSLSSIIQSYNLQLIPLPFCHLEATPPVAIMQFNVVFITTVLLSSASLAVSVTITLFALPDCTGPQLGTLNAQTQVCLTWGRGATVKSIRYCGVPNKIQFYISGGAHDSCTNGASMTVDGGCGCVTAPAG